MNPSETVVPSVPSDREGEFSITRTFNAPREMVWKALTESQHLMHWWGPKGFEMMAANMDLRPGGTFHYGLKTPDGHEMWGKWTFTEIVPPSRLSYIVAFSDAQGGITRHPMSQGWPLEMLSAVTLTESGGRTTLTITATAYNATPAERQTFLEGHSSMEQGFGGTMDQLESYLATL